MPSSSVYGCGVEFPHFIEAKSCCCGNKRAKHDYNHQLTPETAAQDGVIQDDEESMTETKEISRNLTHFEKSGTEIQSDQS